MTDKLNPVRETVGSLPAESSELVRFIWDGFQTHFKRAEESDVRPYKAAVRLAVRETWAAVRKTNNWLGADAEEQVHGPGFYDSEVFLDIDTGIHEQRTNDRRLQNLLNQLASQPLSTEKDGVETQEWEIARPTDNPELSLILSVIRTSVPSVRSLYGRDVQYRTDHVLQRTENYSGPWCPSETLD